jgi:hypothetical protein
VGHTVLVMVRRNPYKLTARKPQEREDNIKMNISLNNEGVKSLSGLHGLKIVSNGGLS